MRKQKLSNHERALLKRIGALVKEGMINQEDTTESLSQRAGVARSTLRECIAGRSNTRIGTLLKIIREIGWSNLTDFMSHVENA